MTRHDQNTLEEQAINFILDLGLAEGLPRVAEMLFQRAAHQQALRTSAAKHAGDTPTALSPAS